MTKHLRLLMLALLAIICTGGVTAQTEQPEVTLNFNDADNPWKFPKGYAKDGKTYTYSKDGDTIQVQVTKEGGCMFVHNSKTGPYSLQCHKSGIGITLPAFNFIVSKIELDIDEPADNLENLKSATLLKSQSVAAQTAKNAIFLVWTDFLPCVG